MSDVPGVRHVLHSLANVRPGVMGGEQAEPQSEHSVVLVGGLAPQTTFKGVPEILEEAAADTLFSVPLPRTLEERKLPV